MTRDDITTEQAKRILNVTSRATGYLQRLRERMDRSGFPPTDPYFQLVTRAHESLFNLNVETHYMSCHGGVGRPSRTDG